MIILILINNVVNAHIFINEKYVKDVMAHVKELYIKIWNINWTFLHKRMITILNVLVKKQY
jgi:hypothetical protein